MHDSAFFRWRLVSVIRQDNDESEKFPYIPNCVTVDWVFHCVKFNDTADLQLSYISSYVTADLQFPYVSSYVTADFCSHTYRAMPLQTCCLACARRSLMSLTSGLDLPCSLDTDEYQKFKYHRYVQKSYVLTPHRAPINICMGTIPNLSNKNRTFISSFTQSDVYKICCETNQLGIVTNKVKNY